MPRFVILEHDYPSLHWDLMLEAGSVLRTWRLAMPPSVGASVPAEASGDHRLLYLDYQGPVSGGRGSVSRWDAGTYEGLSESEGEIEFRLEGRRIGGKCRLVQDEEGRWRFSLTAASG